MAHKLVRGSERPMPRLYLFVCPNANGWHIEEHIAYLLLFDYALIETQDKMDGGRLKWTYVLQPKQGSFVFIDDPGDGMVFGIADTLAADRPDFAPTRVVHTCVHCRIRGVLPQKEGQ